MIARSTIATLLAGNLNQCGPQLLLCQRTLTLKSPTAITTRLDYNSGAKDCALADKESRLLHHSLAMAGTQFGMKELTLLQHFFFALLLVFFSFSFVTCNTKVQNYNEDQLDALQAVWNDWNRSTTDLSSNLAGWNSTQIYRCQQYITGNSPNWRGVQCLTNIKCKTNSNTSEEVCSAFIVGLVLNDASIVGSLPPAIGNINTLTTLELTGNPNLGGLLPATLGNTQLITLDLHDNAFYGEIPDIGNFEWLLTMDLSGNRFNGPFPLYQIRTMKYLQKLNLGRNDFEGEILELAFENFTQLVSLDLSSNRFNGSLPTLASIKHLQVLDMSNNSFSGTLPDWSTMSSLRTVDLSNNKFSGTLSAFSLIKNLQILNLSSNALSGSAVLSSYFSMTQKNSLSVLDLSHNQLTSSLDSWTGTELGSLEELYLDFNRITGTLDISRLQKQGWLKTKSANSSGLLGVVSLMNNSISEVLYAGIKIEEVITVFRLQGNPFCESPDSSDETRCFCKQICFNSAPLRNSDKRKVVIIVVVTVVSSLLVLMISLAALFHRNKRYERYLQLQVQQKFEEFEVKPTIFPYNQLKTATRDFHPDMKLGQGAYGAVFKGILSNGHVVAVKQLFAKTNQGIDEFLNEVVLLTGMKHRNLVNLKGCCIREQQRLLVYEYVDNYDIDHVLLAGPNKALLSWPVRMKICLGVARGLHYLHALAHPKIIHRDIKASNILLTQSYEAKIADFGLALLFPDEESYILTKHVAGTKGYLAPEYASYGQLSDKVDVFSFGVLCLEVVSGRRNIDDKLAPHEMYLSKWAWELHREGRLMDMVDPALSLQDEEVQEVHRLINTALLCIQNAADQRPSMERVVAILQGDSESESMATLQGGTDEEYLDTIRLFAVGNSGLVPVKEDGESSFMNSTRSRLGDEALSTGATLELSEIRVR